MKSGTKKGTKFSEDHKRKIRESNKKTFKEKYPNGGRVPWNKGKVYTQILGDKHPMYGKHHDEATRKRISESLMGHIPWNKGKLGEESHCWKGGLTPLNMRIRHSWGIQQWRKACLIRDNFTDQKTGISGGKLVVHHINNFKEFPELRTSIDNGITLSEESHREFHKIYGYSNNTRDQLEEYLITNFKYND